MSKKQLLTESEIRRFMKLANLPAIGKEFISEMSQSGEERKKGGPLGSLAKSEAVDPLAPAMDAAAGGMPAEMPGEAPVGDVEGGEMVDMGDEVDPEKKEAFQAAVQALADAMGISVELEGGDDMGGDDMGGDDMGGDEMPDLEAGPEGEEAGEEDADDAEGEEGGEEEKDDEEMQEAQVEEEKGLSEDELVETVLARVTARLVAEAKKKKMSVKEKMKLKAKVKKDEKKEEKKEKVDEATDAKGGGPLLSKGGNKHDIYKGHADMKMGKGEKGGTGGHKMEDLTAKAENTVTHGRTNLATKGGNKKK